MNGWWLWVALVGAAPARPAQVWTLEDLFRQAVARNQELLARQVRVQAEAWNRMPAGSLPSPMVGYMWDPTDAPWNRQGWVVSQTVPFPMKLWERVQVQNRRVDQAEAVRQLVRARLLKEVEMAYHDLMYARAWDALIQDYREVLQGAQRVSTSRYRTGLRPLKEPVRWQLERARLDAEQAAVRALLQDARLRLTALLRLPEPLDPSRVAPPETLREVEGALEHAPRLEQARAQQETAEAMARLRFWSLFPDVRLQAQSMERMGMVMWGAMLTVPLFLPFRELPRWKSGRLNARAARMETSQLFRDLSARLDGMHAAWRALAVRDSLLRTDILPGAEAFFASVEAAFRGGSAGYLEFLDAYRELYRAKKEWLQNRREQGYLHARMAALLGYPNVKEGGQR